MATTFLSRLPKPVVPILVAVGVIGGLALGGPVGFLLLLAVAAVLGSLLRTFWPVLPPAGRVIRVSALTALVVIGLIQL